MSSLIIRNVRIDGRRTSVRLEPSMWEALLEISERENQSFHDICTMVDRNRTETGFTSGLRVFILDYFWRPTGGSRRRSTRSSPPPQMEI
jgi:predicted DNA-binding ribbon-helix-helix protein